MDNANSERVGKGIALLKSGLAPFVSNGFIESYKTQGKAKQIVPDLERIVGETLDPKRPFRDMDAAALLKVMWSSWNEVFRVALGHPERSLVSELRAVRNNWAHQKPFSDENAYRALDSIHRLLTAVGSHQKAKIAEGLKLEQLRFLAGKQDGQATGSVAIELGPAAGTDTNRNGETPVSPASGPEQDAGGLEVVAAAAVEPDGLENSDLPQPADADFSMSELIQRLHAFDALREGDVVAQDTLERVEPLYGDDSVFRQIAPKLARALREQGITRLYEHQTEAISAALAGNNVVLEAPTASGKTLAFAIPMINRLLTERGHALMLYPMKAVANDQRQQLFDLLKSAGLESWLYDGDTEPEHRKLLRENPPSVLITNPEMLNRSFLAYNEQWVEFLKNLKFVVVDEMHEYRGYFGSNMSLLLRRLAHHLALIGASPQYFLATATCANPLEHAENLTGQTFSLVSAQGRLAPRRHFAFVDPLSIPDFQFRNIFELRIRNAALACMEQGKAVIVFCPSRRFAEQCYSSALLECENRGLDADSVALFKAGLSDRERHEIQRSMRDGSKRLVFSTNALELGIDIGGLDGVILAGFPDTVMSAWQRIGRAGRGWDKDAFVLFYAMNDPVNKFYAANLPTFLKKPLDEIVADPGNEELITNHLPPLLYESKGNIDPAAELILGSPMYRVAREQADKFRPVKGFSPHQRLPIRGSGGRMWTLKYGSEEIGTMSDYQKFREAYEGAIYLQAGHKYKVDSTLAGSSNEINLATPDLAYSKTNPVFIKSLNVQELFNGAEWQDGPSTYLGKVSLYENLISVSLVDERSDSVIDRYSPDSNSSWRSTSHAFWVDVSPLEDIDDAGLTALEQLLRVGTIFTIPVDAHDTTTHLDKRDRQIYVIESHPGGIGIVKKAFEKWHEILRTAIGIAQACRCRRGCPNCIIPPRLYDEELDKVKGIALAERVMASTGGSPDKRMGADGLWK